MDLTLDYNVELYPLQADQSFALALASSLARGPNAGGDEDEKDRDVWRPDGKGRRGLEEDYEYVMYGKVCRLPAPSPVLCTGAHRVCQVYKFDGGQQEIVYVIVPVSVDDSSPC